MDGDGIETRFSDIVPNELMVNILIRIRVKSLKRFCCVNKSWYNLIHSSYFISKHYSHHSSYNVKLLVKRVHGHICTGKDVISFLSESESLDYNDNDITTPFSNYHNHNHNHNDVGPRIDIIGPCINGILCLEISTAGFSLHDVALWNLSTREYIRLPKFHFSNPSIWEPCIEGLGFGWVPETNEYKVIIAIQFWENPSSSTEYSSSPPIPYPGVQVYVYTQTTNSWNQLSFETPFESDSLQSSPPFNSQVYRDGVCYWVNKTADNLYLIFSFNMRDEIFGTLPLPPNFGTLTQYGHPTLSILDDCIALILTAEERDSTNICIDVWVMMDDESWIKKLNIGPLYNISSMVGFVKDDFFLEDESGQLLSINSKSHQLKNLHILGAQYTFQVLEYVESLFPIKRPL